MVTVKPTFLFPLFFVFVFPAKLWALTIDPFDSVPQVQAVSGANSEAASAAAGAAGGWCGAVVQVDSGAVGVGMRVRGAAGQLLHSQDVTASGTTLLIWDGDGNPGVSASGLAGIDLTQDGGSQFKLIFSSFDLPSGKPLSLTVTVYDSTDASGGKFSRGTTTVTAAIAGESVLLPFAQLAQAGPAGAADFTKVGALTLAIGSVDVPDADVALDWFGTDGSCAQAPGVGGAVMDACGVCGGDGSSCLDCAGVPNGGASVDHCGVCGGDGTSCLECKKVVMEGQLLALDGGAFGQEKVAKKALKRLKAVDSTPATQEFVAAQLKMAQELYMANWTLTYKLPGQIIDCEVSQFCLQVNLAPVFDTYNINAKKLRDIGANAVARLKKLGKFGKSEKKLLKDVQKSYNKTQKHSAAFPKQTEACA